MDEYEVIRISPHNIHLYTGLMPEDVSSRIGRRPFEGMVVERVDGGEVEAAMVWRRSMSKSDAPGEWEIIWLMGNTPEAFKGLWDEFKSEAVSGKAKRVDFELKELNPEVSEILTAEGFTLTEGESTAILFTLGEVAKEGKISGCFSEEVKPLRDLRARTYIKAVDRLYSHHHDGIIDDLRYLPMSWFDEDVSCALIYKDRVQGMLLVSRRPSGILYMDLMFIFPKASKAASRFLIENALGEALKKYPKDTPVRVLRSNSRVKSFTRALFPRKRGETVMKGSLIL